MTKTIELKYPIFDKDKNGKIVSISTLKLSRIKAKHLKMLPEKFFRSNSKNDKDSKGEDGGPKISPAEMLPLIAALCNLPEEAVDEIDVMEDLITVCEALESFLSESLQTGKN